MKKVTEIVAELAAPVAAEFGCELWDTEYVREAGQWFLRLYLDKDGGVDILDCENVSRKVSDLLDETDPIEGSYIFEVSSAGAERQLKRPSDFEKFLGRAAENLSESRRAEGIPRGAEGVRRQRGGAGNGQAGAAVREKRNRHGTAAGRILTWKICNNLF